MDPLCKGFCDALGGAWRSALLPSAPSELRWFAPHNRELATLTGDGRYLEWNKDPHGKGHQAKGHTAK